MFLVAIIAGIAQAVPEISGTTLLPDKPNDFIHQENHSYSHFLLEWK
jgi:hypothetical protein